MIGLLAHHLAAPVAIMSALVATNAGSASDTLSTPALYESTSSKSLEQREAPATIAARIGELGRSFGDGVGISVRSINDGWSASYSGDRLCPQQSVSKMWVALTVFDAIDRGELNLGDEVIVKPSDLTLFNQPIRALVGATGYRSTIADLLERSITASDNTANDVLLWRAGGPNAVRKMLTRARINNVRFGPGERMFQSQIAGMTWRQAFSIGNGFGDARAMVPAATRRAAFDSYMNDPTDGAAPAAITSALARLSKGELLSAQSTRDMLALMGRTKTGRSRLKAAVAPNWTLAHKTGTGPVLGSMQAGFNDVGLLTAPDGHQYAVAVMVAKSVGPTRSQMLIADVARAVIGEWSFNKQFASRETASRDTGSR